MILVIPSINLTKGHCFDCIVGESGTEKLYSNLAANISLFAQLLRRENSKSIHIRDIDSFDGNNTNENLECVINAVGKVDIPIQFSRMFSSLDECDKLLESGVYRIIIDSKSHLINDSAVLIDKYNSSRVAIGIEYTDGDDISSCLKEFRNCGGERAIYSNINWDPLNNDSDFTIALKIAGDFKIRLTLDNAVSNYRQLAAISNIGAPWIDSVIIGKPLYLNNFPCQKIWRIAESELERN